MPSNIPTTGHLAVKPDYISSQSANPSEHNVTNSLRKIKAEHQHMLAIHTAGDRERETYQTTPVLEDEGNVGETERLNEM
jgi:hypothetical protein